MIRITFSISIRRPRMASRYGVRPLPRLSAAPVAQATPQYPSRGLISSACKPNGLQLTRAATKPSVARAIVQTVLRRSYADAAPPKSKRRIRGFFRWTWRLTYLSAIGGVGYLAYNIYLLRTPSEQHAPDPNKKSLVVLGMTNS